PTPSAASSPNAAWINGPFFQSDKRLDSPPLNIARLPATLIFNNNFNFESGHDGGVLEFSTDGGNSFQDIQNAGGIFQAGGYTNFITSNTNPLLARQAWTGNSGGFITTAVKLPSTVAGHDIILRWRMGSDNNGTQSQGWRIDNVSITCATPTPTPT